MYTCDVTARWRSFRVAVPVVPTLPFGSPIGVRLLNFAEEV